MIILLLSLLRTPKADQLKYREHLTLADVYVAHFKYAPQSPIKPVKIQRFCQWPIIFHIPQIIKICKVLTQFPDPTSWLNIPGFERTPELTHKLDGAVLLQRKLIHSSTNAHTGKQRWGYMAMLLWTIREAILLMIAGQSQLFKHLCLRHRRLRLNFRWENKLKISSGLCTG